MISKRFLPLCAVAAFAVQMSLWGSFPASPPWQTAATVATTVLVLLLAIIAGRRDHRITSALEILPELVEQAARGEKTTELPDELSETAASLVSFGEYVRRERTAREEAELAAVTDPLTNLPNRRGLFDWMNGTGQALARHLKGRLGVMHIDLDHFKAINDTMGHGAGDQVLKEAALRMASVVRDTDLVARLGGDEFIILLPGVDTTESLTGVAERVQDLLSEPVDIDGAICPLSASIGLLIAGREGEMPEPTRMLVNADTALCQAKASGRGCAVLYTSSMGIDLVRRRELASDLEEALKDQKLFAQYRPILDQTTGGIVAVEILPQWLRPKHGVLGPEDFGVAADIHRLGEEVAVRVLDQVLQQASIWQRDGLDMPPMLFDPGGAQLLSVSLIDAITWRMDQCSLSPEMLHIIASETALTGRNGTLIRRNLDRFRKHGLNIAIGEFGQAGGVLSHILDLACQHVLLSCAGPDREVSSADILDALMVLEGRNGLQITVTGVQTDDQLSCLVNRGVRLMSGEAIGPVLDAPEFAMLLAKPKKKNSTARARLA